MYCSQPGSSVFGILQARILGWVAMPSSWGSSWSRDRIHVSCLLHWQMGSLPLVPLEKPFVIRVPLYIHFFFFPTLVSFLYLLVPSSHWSVWLTLHCGPDYPKEVLKSFKLQFQLLVTISLWFKDIIGYIMYHHIIYFYTENHLLFFSDFKLFILYWGIAN